MLPPVVGMKKRPCRFSDLVLQALSMELVLLVLEVLDDLRPRVS